MLFVIVVVLLVAAVWLWKFKPWIAEPPSLEPPEFARQMNELLGASEASNQNSAAVQQAIAAIKADVSDAESKAIEDADPQAVNSDDFPGNAVELVLREPPRGVAAARAFAKQLEDSHRFTVLCGVLAAGAAIEPWNPDVPVSDQLGDRITNGGERSVALWLLARMRLAAIDGQPDRSIESFEALVRLSRNRLNRLLLIDVLMGAAQAQRATEELRLEVLEHMLGEPQLARADQVLAESYPDWEKLCTYSERLLRGEGLYWLASSRTALDDSEVPNTKENRRKSYEASVKWEAELRSVLCAEPLRPNPKDPPSLDEALSEVIQPSGDLTKSIAASNSMVMNAAHGIRRMVAVVQGTRVMIAIERARLRAGVLPRTLDDIPPDLRGEPTVQFTAIRYVPQADGRYNLYAFGPDGVDNAGKINESFLGDTRAGSDILLSETRREVTERQEQMDREADPTFSAPETPPTPPPDE